MYLSKKDVESLAIPMKRIIASLEEMFREKGQGRVEMPPKPGLHPQPDAFIHAMPAYIPKFQSAGIKWVSGFPANVDKRLPYIHGLLILNDTETGIPTSVMDCTWITAMRTGAATAIAAKYLARPESSSVGIIACGVQGRSNLAALIEVFKIRQVKAFDLYPEVALRFAKDMQREHNIEVEVVSELRQAVTDMDIVVTSGPIHKNPRPPIPAGWLKKGAFVSPVDFDSYFQGEAFLEASKIATDDLKQMQYYREAGYFRHTPKAYADLGQIVCGMVPGRESEDEINFAINLGLALEDMAVAPDVYRIAREQKVGTWLPF